MENNLCQLQMMQTLTVNVVFSFAIHSLFITPALAANTGIVDVNELASSSSHIIAMKNSAVWLHWNYTYGGDISAITYKEQIIGCNSSSQPFRPLAKRAGANGALTVASPLPSEFSGRIEVISSNSTLVIKNLQLNDSTFSFSSYVVLTVKNVGDTRAKLKPAVRVTVQGVPEFTVSPRSSIEVEEGTSLTVAVEMNGNPQPSVDFSWPHLGQAPTNLPSKEIYPYVFSSKYNSPPLGASYCGRNLITLAKNSAGLSPPQSTNVTVLLKLDIDQKVEAGKIADQRCVEVKWNKAESGLCFVKYKVKFKNASGSIIYTEIGYNVNSKKKCSIPEKINITSVELTMSFKTSTKTTTVKVSENPIPTTAAPTTTHTTTHTTASTPPDTNTPGTTKTTDSLSSSSDVPTVRTVSTTASKDPGKQTGPSTGVIVGATFGGVIFLILIILLVLFLVKRSKRNQKKRGSGESEYQLQDNKMDNPYAMAGNPKQNPYEPAYADPKAQTVTYGKLGPGGGRKGPRPAKREDVSDYADVKLDEHGYPAIGAMPVSYSDGYDESNRSGARGERDSGRRVAPDRRPPPPYNDSSLDDDGYPVSKNQPPIYAQVNKKR